MINNACIVINNACDAISYKYNQENPLKSLLTPYGKQLGDIPLGEYPRPQMARASFFCLNGRWQYAITAQEGRPTQADGSILVPFAPESLLSGVERVLQPHEFLWYWRSFSLPVGFVKDRVLLHFGGVDQCCTVQVNGRVAGHHDGGFLPFTIDITEFLQAGENELSVMVIDETDDAPYSRGRQRLAPGGLWHTPQSGIWQTVWLESVPEAYIKDLRLTPLYDESAVELLVEGTAGLTGQVEIFAHKTMAARADFVAGSPLRLDLPGAISWSPDHPFLYTVRLRAGDDLVASYFGMRKIALGRTGDGHMRIHLNNRPLFIKGVFDLGMYSDGLYTPPSDKAMADDAAYAKACGFNLIRKHGKIEPLRWYYHCDVEGILVWQDLPAGGTPGKEPRMSGLFGDKRGPRDSKYRSFGRESAEGRQNFRRDMAQAAALLASVPSLVGWTLFHDGWGQFDAYELAREMHTLDPGRLVDHASGRFDQGGGDIHSLHWAGENPVLPKNAGWNSRAVVLSAVGGYGLVEPGHYGGETPHSALRMANRAGLLDSLKALWREGLAPLIEQGLAGFVYLQLTDAEDEASGLLTCDREVQKVTARELAALNRALEP